MFTQDQIQEIQALFRAEFGMEVSPEEACRHMAQFLNLLSTVYKDEPSHSESMRH